MSMMIIDAALASRVECTLATKVIGCTQVRPIWQREI